MSFEQRFKIGSEAEERFGRLLRNWGYVVNRVGQGYWSPELTEMLKDFIDDSGYPSELRWFPELLVGPEKQYARPKPSLIDVKTRERKTSDSIFIEKAAIEFCELLVAAHQPTFFTIDGLKWGILTPREARQRGQHCESPNGSGTACFRIERRWIRPLEEFFPNHTGMGRNLND